MLCEFLLLNECSVLLQFGRLAAITTCHKHERQISVACSVYLVHSLEVFVEVQNHRITQGTDLLEALVLLDSSFGSFFVFSSSYFVSLSGHLG